MAAVNGSLLRKRLRSFAGKRISSGKSAKLLDDSDDASADEEELRTPKDAQSLIHSIAPSSSSQSESISEPFEDTFDETDTLHVGVGATRKSGASPEQRKTGAEVYASSAHERESTASKGWYEFDLSVILALVSPLGNWLTGGDHIKNLLLILLLIFYLHQIIEIPWNLYHASRPRRRPQAVAPDASTEDRFHHIASSELRTLEFLFLCLTVLSPFLGAILLRSIITAVSGPDTISWFSTSLFVLATGMRPWKHAIERFRERVLDLHDVVHYPRPGMRDTETQIEALAERVARLEKELKETKAKVEDVTEEIYEHVDDAIDSIEKTARRQEKKADVIRTAIEGRFVKLEHNLDMLCEESGAGVRSDASYSVVSPVSSVHWLRPTAFISMLTVPLYNMIPSWLYSGQQERDHHHLSPLRSPNIGRSFSGPKLETIQEDMLFNPQPAPRRDTGIHVPGLNLVFRIGDLATLPVRTVVHFLLSRRFYSPSKDA